MRIITKGNIALFLIFMTLILCATTRRAWSAQAEELWTVLEYGAPNLLGVNVAGWENLEIPATEGNSSIFLNGEKGEMSSRLTAQSDIVAFGNMDDDDDLELATVIPKEFGTQQGITCFKRAMTDWEEMHYWTDREVDIYGLHDFDGDGKVEILGANEMSYQLLDPETKKVIWTASGGPNKMAAIADVDGNGYMDIVAVQWRKNPNGRFTHRDMFDTFSYDLLINVLDPATGKAISTSEGASMPRGRPISADLDGDGADEVLFPMSDGLIMFKDGVSKLLSHVIQADVDELRVKYGDKIEIPRESFGFVSLNVKFTGMGVGDFHSDPGLELALATELGQVIAINADNDMLWEADTGMAVDPVVADFDGDGKVEVIVALVDGRVAGLDGNTGEELWTLTTVLKPTDLFVGDVTSNGRLDLLIAGRKGIALWTMNAPGKVEWATPYGDAAASGNYRLSRDYCNYLSDTRYIILFPFFKEGVGVLIIGLAVFGVVMYFRRGYSAKEIIREAEEAGELPKLERAYARDQHSLKTVMPLAREYAKSNAIGIRAAEVYTKALAMAPNDVGLIMAAANAYAARQMLTGETEAVFQKALENDPDMKLVESLVRLFTKNQRSDPLALHIYHRYFTAENYDKRLLKITANTLGAKGSNDQFSSWLYQVALATDPADITLLPAMLTSLRAQNRVDEYVAWAMRYVADPRLHANQRAKISNELNEMGRIEESEQFLGGGSR